MPTRGFTDPGTRRVSHYDPLLSTSYATSSLWKTCPILEFLHDPSIGVLIDEKFVSYNAQATTGDYILTQATSGTAAISTVYPGTLAIDAGAATSTQGVNLQRAKTALIPAANKSIWFEANVRMTTTIVSELFIGPSAIDTTIIASSALSNNNRIGWNSVTDNGVLLFDADKAGTALTAIAATTISTSAWTRLGFYYDGVADTVQQFINGVATGAAVPTVNIPKVAVYPSFVCQAAGTGQPVLNVGGYRIFQLR